MFLVSRLSLEIIEYSYEWSVFHRQNKHTVKTLQLIGVTPSDPSVESSDGSFYLYVMMSSWDGWKLNTHNAL